MQTQLSFMPPTVQGRESKRLEQKFKLKSFAFEYGLWQKLFQCCGGRDGLGFALGRALHRHSCCVWGPVPSEDRRLNDHIAQRRTDQCTHGLWVVSRHRVGGVLVEITTEVVSGQTVLRRAIPLTRQLGTKRE